MRQPCGCCACCLHCALAPGRFQGAAAERLHTMRSAKEAPLVLQQRSQAETPAHLCVWPAHAHRGTYLPWPGPAWGGSSCSEAAAPACWSSAEHIRDAPPLLRSQRTPPNHPQPLPHLHGDPQRLRGRWHPGLLEPSTSAEACLVCSVCGGQCTQAGFSSCPCRHCWAELRLLRLQQRGYRV